MKQQRWRAARARCVKRKHLKLLEKAYLFCIILSWRRWSKVKRELILIIYYKTLSFTLLVLVFSLPQPISDCVSCLVIHNIW